MIPEGDHFVFNIVLYLLISLALLYCKAGNSTNKTNTYNSKICFNDKCKDFILTFAVEIFI